MYYHCQAPGGMSGDLQTNQFSTPAGDNFMLLFPGLVAMPGYSFNICEIAVATANVPTQLGDEFAWVTNPLYKFPPTA